MYTIDDIKEFIETGKKLGLCTDNFIKIDKMIEVPFEEVVCCHGFDELIDILDEYFCEEWLPKFDCNYELIDCGKGFYYTYLNFLVTILVNIEEFYEEYGEE